MSITKSQKNHLEERLQKLENDKKWYLPAIILAFIVFYFTSPYGYFLGILVAVIGGWRWKQIEDDINDIKFKLKGRVK